MDLSLRQISLYRKFIVTFSFPLLLTSCGYFNEKKPENGDARINISNDDENVDQKTKKNSFRCKKQEGDIISCSAITNCTDLSFFLN